MVRTEPFALPLSIPTVADRPFIVILLPSGFKVAFLSCNSDCKFSTQLATDGSSRVPLAARYNDD